MLRSWVFLMEHPSDPQTFMDDPDGARCGWQARRREVEEDPRQGESGNSAVEVSFMIPLPISLRLRFCRVSRTSW